MMFTQSAGLVWADLLIGFCWYEYLDARADLFNVSRPSGTTSFLPSKNYVFLPNENQFVFRHLQEDKDLVHEFVQNDGLACLIRVGQCADQNFQNYILRGKDFNYYCDSNDLNFYLYGI